MALKWRSLSGFAVKWLLICGKEIRLWCQAGWQCRIVRETLCQVKASGNRSSTPYSTLYFLPVIKHPSLPCFCRMDLAILLYKSAKPVWGSLTQHSLDTRFSFVWRPKAERQGARSLTEASAIVWVFWEVGENQPRLHQPFIFMPRFPFKINGWCNAAEYPGTAKSSKKNKTSCELCKRGVQADQVNPQSAQTEERDRLNCLPGFPALRCGVFPQQQQQQPPC